MLIRHFIPFYIYKSLTKKVEEIWFAKSNKSLKRIIWILNPSFH